MKVRRSPWQRGLTSTLCVALLVSLAACSGSSGTATPNGSSLSTTTTLPPPTSGSCDDPTGDLSDSGDANVVGTLTEPAGIDIVHADAVVTAKTLQISIRTAGPISSVPVPFFSVGSGPSANDLSFEVRLEPTGAAGSPWGLTVATFKRGADTKKPLNTPVKVLDNYVTTEVQLSDLPPIVSTLWIFGSVSGEGDKAVSDDCNNLSIAPNPNGSAPGSVPPRTTAPPTTLAPIPFGTEQTYTTTGSKVTVIDAQFPPKNPRPPQGSIPPFNDGFAGGVVNVQVCAPATKATQVVAAYFQVKMTNNQLFYVWAYPDSLVQPAFPTEPHELAAGDCLNGWITFELPTDQKIAAVYYSPDSSGKNFLIWKVT